MTLLDQAIDALRTHHDRLAAVILDLDDDALTGASGAAQWRLCDVLSHLGSGAEISYAALASGITGEGEPVDNQAVWDRWNAMDPRTQATGFLTQDGRVVSLLERLTAEQRESVTVDLGFLPEPVPLVVAVGMRLNEVALHAWDVEAGLEEEATVDAESADVLLELYAGPLGFLLGFTGKADALDGAAEVSIGEVSIVIGDGVSIAAPSAPTAELVAEPEAVVRLISGRLAPERTPPGVTVTGDVGLDDLRRVFPGF